MPDAFGLMRTDRLPGGSKTLMEFLAFDGVFNACQNWQTALNTVGRPSSDDRELPGSGFGAVRLSTIPSVGQGFSGGCSPHRFRKLPNSTDHRFGVAPLDR